MNAPIIPAIYRMPLLQQGSAEWHEHRAQYFNASEAGAVMGISPFTPRTPLQLALVRRGELKVAYTPAMRRGVANEELARQCAEIVFEESFSPSVFSRGRYSASLDGISLDGRTVLEVKVPAKGAASDLWRSVEDNGTVPEYYLYQCAQQWYCSGAERVIFWVYCPDNDCGTGCILEASDLAPAWEALQAAWEKFAEETQDGGLPAAIEGDIVEERRQDAIDAAAELLGLRRQIAELEARAKSAEGALREIVQPGLITVIRSPAGAIRAQWATRAGSVDYAKVPELQGVDLEPYRKKSTTYLTIKEVT